ncbi:MAG: DUF2834 domain-containing protein [Pseudomonas sp.]|uniref:DUF2834 domain-containing protein n=1 Tax=Pseudomonas sp. TaxID=306 RepID=UPI0030F0D1E8
MRTLFLPLAALLLFALYTGWTLLTAEQSLLALGLELLSRPDTAQVLIDLYLMATLACIWMVNDTRARGQSPASVLPYVLLTLVFVSIGPLLYLVIKQLRERRA